MSAVSAFSPAALSFALMERRRKNHAKNGPQRPMTVCCRYQIPQVSNAPGQPSADFLAKLKARDSQCEVIYDPHTEKWHLYRIKTRGGTPGYDLLVLQDIDFGKRGPGNWLLLEMDRADRWRKHGSAKAAWRADMQAEKDNDDAMDKREREFDLAVAEEVAEGRDALMRESIIVP